MHKNMKYVMEQYLQMLEDKQDGFSIAEKFTIFGTIAQIFLHIGIYLYVCRFKYKYIFYKSCDTGLSSRMSRGGIEEKGKD